MSPLDRAFEFDNDHSGKLDYIATYRPGTNTFWIIQNDNGISGLFMHREALGVGFEGMDSRLRQTQRLL
jgi:hypothetical protein